jgi:hypothetical protein
MASATEDMRQRSRRVDARSDLPEAVSRFLPTRHVFVPAARSWAHILDRRTGWFGVIFRGSAAAPAAGENVLLLFLSTYEGVTSCLRWDLSAGDGEVLLPPLWSVSSAMVPLEVVWEENRANTHVGVFAAVVLVEYVRVPGTPLPTVRVRTACAQEVSEPLLRRRQPAADGESDDGEEDGAPEEARGTPAGGVRPSGGARPSGGSRPKRSPDSESDATASVDTGVESESSGSDSSEHEAVPTPTGKPSKGKRSAPSRVRVWEDTWFYITQHKSFRDCKISVKGVFAQPLQMGAVWKSKALTPTHYGETLAKPAITHCLLRAWGLWRARRFGWTTRQASRARQDATSLKNLVREIVALDGRTKMESPLFGSKRAQKQLQNWAPDAVRLALAD